MAVIEELDYEVIRSSMIEEFKQRAPEWSAELESDPVVILLELAGYRELLLRQRINEASRALMLAYAGGSDIDHLAANVGLERLDDETDDRLRDRVQLGFYLAATAGPAGAYKLHTLNVSADVLDVHVWMPAPGEVQVVVLARQTAPEDATETELQRGVVAFGTDDEWIIARSDGDLMNQIRDVLNQEETRPLTDSVVVRTPEIIECVVQAELTLYPGPDADLLLAESLTALNDYLLSVRRPAHDLTMAGIIDALVVPGVQNVKLIEPAADIVAADSQMPLCSEIYISIQETRNV